MEGFIDGDNPWAFNRMSHRPFLWGFICETYDGMEVEMNVLFLRPWPGLEYWNSRDLVHVFNVVVQNTIVTLQQKKKQQP